MQTFTHNPTDVEAIHVVRPYVNVSRAVPFAHLVKKPGTAAFQRFKVSPPHQEMFSAYEDDWIVRYPSGFWLVMSPEQFARYYLPPIVDDIPF